MSQQIEELLYSQSNTKVAIELGLDRCKRVYENMGIEIDCPIITVAGTNGKGSTCHFLEAIALANRFAVCVYSSPHLVSFCERIRINGQLANESSVIDALNTVNAHALELNLTLSYFERSTLAALLLFAQSKPELVILEVGMGGRLDAVNILDADVAVVTNIALDHTEFLGDSLGKIAYEKAGITRPNKPVVIGTHHPPAELLAHCDHCNPIYLLGRDFSCKINPSAETGWSFYSSLRNYILPLPAMRATYQFDNFSTALMAWDTLSQTHQQLISSTAAIRNALQSNLLGRMQIIDFNPTIILDVAHNPPAARLLADALLAQGYFKNTVFILNLAISKDINSFIAAISKRCEHCIILAHPELASATLVAQACERLAISHEICSSYSQAIKTATLAAKSHGRIVACGSHLIVANALEYHTHPPS